MGWIEDEERKNNILAIGVRLMRIVHVSTCDLGGSPLISNKGEIQIQLMVDDGVATGKVWLSLSPSKKWRIAKWVKACGLSTEDIEQIGIHSIDGFGVQELAERCFLNKQVVITVKPPANTNSRYPYLEVLSEDEIDRAVEQGFYTRQARDAAAEVNPVDDNETIPF